MKKTGVLLIVAAALLAAGPALGAYHHMDEQDAPKFQQAYPHLVGTKLDDCALCHAGGEYEKKPGKFVTVGSCQWCHMTYGYDGSGDVMETLNNYGSDYLSAGRSVSAFAAIESLDSDNDTYTNKQELDAIRYPGDAGDDPSLVPAPRIVYTLEELEAMESHTQFMLMNTSRGGTDGNDYYTEYTGVTMETLLDESGMRSKSESVTVYAPDGWAQTFDKEEGGDNYWVVGEYPQATYYYDAEADAANGGWVDYSSPGCQGREDGQAISNENGLRCLLAYKRDGAYLDPGFLTSENKLEGEGPYRVVPPQKNPGPPDQLSTSENQSVVWPYDEDEDETDHNAGNSPRTATAVRVDPLPEGTTDFNWYEGGWSYVDNNQVIVYGYIRNGDIEGVVSDENGQPIEKAKVETDRGGYETLTASDGTYSLGGVACGPDTATYTLTVSASGFSEKSIDVTVENKESIVQDFTLSSSGGDGDGSDNSTCPVELAAGDDTAMVDLFRRFRDTCLNASSAGRRYVSLYYRSAPEVTLLALRSREVRVAVGSALGQLAPIAAACSSGGSAVIPQQLADDLYVLIDLLQARASTQLSRRLAGLKSDLQDGTLESILPVVIEQ